MIITDRIDVSARTQLPVPVATDASLPQYDAVSWALTVARKMLYGEPATATLVLVAYAQHARAALFSGDGYLYTTTATVAYLTGLSESTVKRYTRLLVQKGLLRASYSMGHRVPESALDGTWA